MISDSKNAAIVAAPEDNETVKAESWLSQAGAQIGIPEINLGNVAKNPSEIIGAIVSGMTEDAIKLILSRLDAATLKIVVMAAVDVIADAPGSVAAKSVVRAEAGTLSETSGGKRIVYG